MAIINDKQITVLKQELAMKNIKQTFTLIGPFLLKRWKAYLGLIVLMGVDLFLTLAFAWFFGHITDAAVKSNFALLKRLIPIGMGLLLLSTGSNFLNTYFESAAVYGVIRDLKTHLYKHTLLIQAKNMAAFRSGDLISRFGNDIYMIEGMLGGRLIDVVRLPIIYLSVFIYLSHINHAMSLISLSIAPLAVAGSAVFGLLLRKNGRRINQITGDATHLLNETFHGFFIIRSFLLERVFYKKFAVQNRKLYSLEMTNAKLRGLYNAGGQAAGSLTFLASLCLGAYFVSEKTITVGALLTFISLVNHLVYPLTGAAGNWASFQSAAAAVERIRQVLDQPVESKQLPVSRPIVPPIRSIVFENVGFHYESGKPVLRNFNLTVPIGKKVAIVGASGAGKTTLFNLLQGFYLPEEGDILINGRPIGSWPLFELRQAIAQVSQDTFLFNGSIRDNLLIGTAKTSKKALEQAAESAAIHSFITSLPKGYRTEIGERGIKLSGGQKQRLAIARAILKDAPILLLDEATSALDGGTERQVKEALDKLMAGRTTFIIAHRLSTIQNADIIIVMKNGRIVEQGRHDELIQAGGLYADLYRSGRSDFNEETRLKSGGGESVGLGF